MKYTQRSFTCLGSESNTYTHARAVCAQHGHMEPDVRGKCLRCGESVSRKLPEGARVGPNPDYLALMERHTLDFDGPDLGMGS